MEICKATTLRLKALNKHTHIMYIEMENVIKKINMYISTSVQAYLCKRCTHTHAHAPTHARTHASRQAAGRQAGRQAGTHARTHIVQTDRDEG